MISPRQYTGRLCCGDEALPGSFRLDVSLDRFQTFRLRMRVFLGPPWARPPRHKKLGRSLYRSDFDFLARFKDDADRITPFRGHSLKLAQGKEAGLRSNLHPERLKPCALSFQPGIVKPPLKPVKDDLPARLTAARAAVISPGQYTCLTRRRFKCISGISSAPFEGQYCAAGAPCAMVVRASLQRPVVEHDMGRIDGVVHSTHVARAKSDVDRFVPGRSHRGDIYDRPKFFKQLTVNGIAA